MPGSVMIIEDEVTLAKNMLRYLQREGYRVTAVGSGEEGLAQINSFCPDVVLVDYRLPRMTGLEVLERLKHQDRHVKTIMITGQGNRDVAVKALMGGAYRYASKPLALSDLKLLVEEAIGSAGTPCCA